MTFEKLQEVVNSDPEFRLAARFWNTALRLEMSNEALLRRIKGAKYQTMTGLGHFPRSEDPERCLAFIEPVLNEIRGRSA